MGTRGGKSAEVMEHLLDFGGDLFASFAEITLSFTTSLHSYRRAVTLRATAAHCFSSYLDVQRCKEPLPLLQRCSTGTLAQSYSRLFPSSRIFPCQTPPWPPSLTLQTAATSDVTLCKTQKPAPDPGHEVNLKQAYGSFPPQGSSAPHRLRV